MENLKVVKVYDESLEFENGLTLSSWHDTSYCEEHYLSFSDLTIDDFEGLQFNLSNDDFFERISGYGVALKPTNGFPVRIPGYGYNNGCYSDELLLVLRDGIAEDRYYDITECQEAKR